MEIIDKIRTDADFDQFVTIEYWDMIKDIPTENLSDHQKGNLYYVFGYFYGNCNEIKNLDKEMECYKKASDYGNRLAMNDLGYMYSNEESFKDINLAIRYYKMSCNLNCSYAMYNLGHLYEQDSDTKDIEEAIKYYKMAIVHGDDDAMYNLGCIYKSEVSVKNLEKAIKYLKMAIKYGNKNSKKDAIEELEELYEHIDNEIDVKSALKRYKIILESKINDALSYQ